MMLQLAPLEAEKETEVSMRRAFESHAQKLKPPFVITNLTSGEYLQLNQALVYGILTQPSLSKIHIKHLHGIVSDGYACFVSLVVKIVNELYVKLSGDVKLQLIWVTKVMINVNGVGIDVLVLSLLRRIVGGDLGEGNLWLCYEMVSMLCENWEWLVEEAPLLVPSVLFVFLRVLNDHCWPSVDLKVVPLRGKEIDFCVRLLRENFHLCVKIGRDLVRILQDLGHVPEFREILNDLFLKPAAFGIPGFSDVMQLYRMRTSSRYFVLRVTPEMEAQLRFLLTYVKFRNQRRYLEWFAKKFLSGLNQEVLIRDIVRFICCAHHPSNEIVQSPVIPRWAVIGWLLKYCEKNYEVANLKLSLFYDWLFFDEGSENIMNIEPAMLLMVYSIPQYIDVTYTLLEFLISLVDSYDTARKVEIASGVKSAFSTLVKKGVVRSLDVLTSCKLLHPDLRKRLTLLLTPTPGPLVPCVNSTTSCRMEIEKSLAPESSEKPIYYDQDRLTMQEPTKSLSLTSDVQANPRVMIQKEKVSSDALEAIYLTFHNNIKQSYAMGLQSLEELLNLLAEIDSHNSMRSTVERIFKQIIKDYESNGHKLFCSESLLKKDTEGEFNVDYAIPLIVRKLILSQSKAMLDVFSFLSSEGFPVRALVLFYSLRLAFEVQFAKDENLASDNLLSANDPRVALLKFYIREYVKKKMENQQAVTSEPYIQKNLLDEFVVGCFTAYRSYLSCSKTIQNSCVHGSPVELLAYDILSCFEWDDKTLSFKIESVFSFFPDLSVGQEVIIRLLVIRLGHADMVYLQFLLGVNKFTIFGNNTEVILLIIKNSVNWDSSVQQKLWGLLRSEVAVSDVKVERLLLEFFGSEELDVNTCSIAAEGLLTLCCCRCPTPELVGAILLLPNNNFQGFSAAVLSTWSMSGSSLLLGSLTEFMEKLQQVNDGSLPSESRIIMNQSATQWILKYSKEKGVSVDFLRNLSLVVPVAS